MEIGEQIMKIDYKDLVSIIVPCYNEQEVLQLFYKEIFKVISSITNYDFEVIFINDGSLDNTERILEKINDEDERFKYISFSRNFGKEAAILAGLENSNGIYVAVMDVDLQDPPSLIPEMLKWLEIGYDSVGTRRISRLGEPPIRSFFARKFYRIMNKISKVDMIDGARDFRMMTRQVVDAILSIKEYHRFTKGIFGWVGFKTKWLEYENIERASGETKWSFGKLMVYAIEGIVGFSTVPLKLASIMGIGISLVAFAYTIYIVIKTLVIGSDVPGYASIVCLVLFLGGIQLLSLGIIGEYMARTYLEVKKRPIYIVKNKSDGIYKELTYVKNKDYKTFIEK